MSIQTASDTTHSVKEFCARSIHDVEIDPSHMPKAMVLPGLNTSWAPEATNVNDALTDVHCLLDQVLSVFMGGDDLPIPQWGAVQQLTMAIGLIDAVHSTMIKLRVVGE